MRNGESRQSPNWAAKIQCHGIRRTISLGTSDRETAAVQARDFYIKVRAYGWDKAFAALRPETRLADVSDITVGQFLDALSQKSDLGSKTLESYARAFRTILADAFGIDDSGKHAQRGTAYENWLARIH